MGWTSMPKPRDVSAWFRQTLTWSSEAGSNRVIDAAIVNRSVGYAAVERVTNSGERIVWAAVFLFRFAPNDQEGYTFSYKDMCEDMGPMEVSCPARILDLLTPTDSKYANEWRGRCRERLERRASNSLSHGDYIRLPNPLSFTGLGQYRTFMFVRDNRRVHFCAIDEDSGRVAFACRIRNWRDKVFERLSEEEIAEIKAGAGCPVLGR